MLETRTEGRVAFIKGTILDPGRDEKVNFIRELTVGTRPEGRVYFIKG